MDAENRQVRLSVLSRGGVKDSDLPEAAECSLNTESTGGGESG